MGDQSHKMVMGTVCRRSHKMSMGGPLAGRETGELSERTRRRNDKALATEGAEDAVNTESWRCAPSTASR